jgi:periplasmic protein TonB
VDKLNILRRLPLLIGFLLVLAIVVGVYAVRDKFQKPAQQKKQIQQITMIAPPPPPPEVQPPPPEEVTEKIDVPEPEPDAAPEAPPGELGVDAEGGAGGDNFGLVGRQGGQALVGGGTGNAIIWYGQKLSSEVSDALRDNLAGKAKGRKFQALINIWIDRSGVVSRAELAAASGDKEADDALTETLASLRLQLSQPPPPNMPQPVKIRVNNN